jgi:hypothetical protein
MKYNGAVGNTPETAKLFPPIWNGTKVQLFMIRFESSED